MRTPSPLEPCRALARFVDVLTGGNMGRHSDAAVRLDALGLGPITPFLRATPEEQHPDLAEVCAPFRRAGDASTRILLLALAEGVAGTRALELRERALFHRVASLLGVPATEAGTILTLASRERAAVESGGDPHDVAARQLLEVRADATADAIDAAYLARIMRFSPAAAVPLGANAVAFAIRWLSEFTLARETLLARCPDAFLAGGGNGAAKPTHGPVSRSVAAIRTV